MVYLSRSSFSGSSSGSDSCADPEKSDGHRNNEVGEKEGISHVDQNHCRIRRQHPAPPRSCHRFPPAGKVGVRERTATVRYAEGRTATYAEVGNEKKPKQLSPQQQRPKRREATYILEGVLIPENLVLLDLVLEELGYPEQ